MSLILKFEDAARREAFLELVRKARPELLPKLEASPVMPHLLARTDAVQDDWLTDQVRGFGRAFSDVQFRTFVPG
jgi:hypothetical protein